MVYYSHHKEQAMKHLIATLFISAAIAVSAADEATIASTNNTVVTANATLKDGSTIKGEFLAQKITGSTIFLKKLALDPSIVKSISFPGTNNAAKIELENGDMFTMKVHNKTFPFASILGELNVQRKNIRSLTLAKRCAAAKGTDAGLVFYCTFDDEDAVKTPAIGPKGTVCSREFVDGKANKAVRVPNGSSAGFFTLPPETFREEGCIEFWAKIEPRREFYRDCDPRMIFIKSPAGWFTVEYSSNNGGGRGGFCIRCFGFEYIKGGPFGGGYKYADVITDITAWHHYAFSWTKDAMTIYIDGNELVGAFKTGDGRIDEFKLQSGPSVMGLPNDNPNPYNTEPNTPFIIDELKIWNHAKQEFGI